MADSLGLTTYSAQAIRQGLDNKKKPRKFKTFKAKKKGK